MILKIYDYIYVRAFKIVSKVNKSTPYSSTARLLSTIALINLMSIFLLFKKSLPKNTPFLVIALGIIIGYYILNRFNDRYAKQIVSQYGLTSRKKYIDRLIDLYPEASIIILSISANIGVLVILYSLMLIVMMRIFFYFASK